jgi:hypothetical protein
VTGFTEYWPLVIGLIIILVVLFIPGGVLGLAMERFKRFGARPVSGGTDDAMNREST